MPVKQAGQPFLPDPARLRLHRHGVIVGDEAAAFGRLGTYAPCGHTRAVELLGAGGDGVGVGGLASLRVVVGPLRVGDGQVLEFEDAVCLAAVGVEGLAGAAGSEEGSAVQGDAEEDLFSGHAALEEVAHGYFAGGFGRIATVLGGGGASELCVVARFGDSWERADEVVGHEVDQVDVLGGFA